jgi:hypothetical protein
MRPRWIIAVPVITLSVVGASVWLIRKDLNPARPQEIGSYQEVTEKIRADLSGTRSRCELGPASPEARAEWRRDQKPRELGKVTLPDLLRHPDNEVALEISSRLFDELYATGLGAMTEPERNVRLIDELAGEVNNGGFHQYFANSSGNCAARARTAVKVIGPELSRIFEEALARFPNSDPSEDRATRNAQMKSIHDEFEAWSHLDDRFYELPFDELVARYVRSNATHFDCPTQRL